MATLDGQVEFRYQVHADGPVFEKYLRKAGRKSYRTWLIYAATQVPIFCMICVSTFAIGKMFTAGPDWGGVFPSFLFGSLCAPIWALYLYETGVQQAVSSLRNKRWDCELTSDHYHFTDNDGVKTSIPWHLMKIEEAEPEYWEISCRDYKVMIYREPLRKAGIEIEFERRVGLGDHGEEVK